MLHSNMYRITHFIPTIASLYNIQLWEFIKDYHGGYCEIFIRMFDVSMDIAICHGLKIRVFYFFYISKTLEMIQISFMASLLNAVL